MELGCHSGQWSGFYEDDGKRFGFNMDISFYGTGSIIGSGIDDANMYGLGTFDVFGFWKKTGEIELEKKYREGVGNQSHGVPYFGRFMTTEKEQGKIKGYFELGRRGDFEMTQSSSRDVDQREQYAESGILFLENLAKFYRGATKQSDDFLSDFIIQSSFGGEDLKCHKIVLASQSDYFQGMFRVDPSVQSVKVDFDFATLEATIEYLYTGHITISQGNVQDILEVANYLRFSDLESRASNFILENLDILNCFDVLDLGEKLGLPVMISASINFIAARMSEVTKSLYQRLFTVSKEIFLKILNSKNLILRSPWDVPLIGNDRQSKLKDLVLIYIEMNPKYTRSDFKGAGGSTESQLYLGCQSSSADIIAEPPISKCYIGDLERRDLRKLAVHLQEWNGSEIVKGMEFTFADAKMASIGLDDLSSSSKECFQFDSDEHILFVHGSSSLYLHNITIITNKGHVLGPIGGEGGHHFSTLDFLNKDVNAKDTHLHSITACIISCGKSFAISKLCFTQVYYTPSQPLDNSYKCDNCDSYPMAGVRYNCLDCACFAICSKCHENGVHSGDGHQMYLYRSPDH